MTPITATFATSSHLQLQTGSISADLLDWATNILNTNLSFQPGDTILIVTDQAMRTPEAEIWLAGALKLTTPEKITLVTLSNLATSGQEPPPEVVVAAKAADITILQTSFSLTHTQVGKAAGQNGGRAASLPGVDLEMMQRLLIQDFTQLATLGTQLKTALEQAETLTITSPAGTNLTTQIRTSAVYNDSGLMQPGQIGNLPAGEVFFAPVLGSTQGVAVIDGSLADEPNLDQPIKVTIENGRAVSFKGGQAAKRLEQKLQAVGPEALTVAEIGLGTNRLASPIASIIEAEKAYGTAHIAFGNSSAIGGEVNVPIHLDGLLLSPTVHTNTNQTLVTNHQVMENL